jgi:hypothetical protein
MENKIEIFKHEAYGSLPVIRAEGKAWFEYMVLLDMLAFRDLSLEPHRFDGGKAHVRVFNVPSQDVQRKAVFVDLQVASYLVRNFCAVDEEGFKAWLTGIAACTNNDEIKKEIGDLRSQVSDLEGKLNLLYNKVMH